MRENVDNKMSMDPTLCSSSVRAFHIDEILTSIFAIIGDLENNQRSKPDLLHCAMTCRLFLDPALDAMWRDMISVMPLVKLIPPRMYGKYRAVWYYFDNYARRIRSLRCQDHKSSSLYIYINEISAERPGHIALPNLNHLHLSRVKGVDLPLPLPTIFPPTLRKFSLKIAPSASLPAEQLGILLQASTRQATNLESLKISGYIVAGPFNSVMSSRGWSSLRSLDLQFARLFDPLDGSVVQDTIAQISSLTYLESLKLPENLTVSDIPDRLGPLHSLKSLTMTATPEAIIKVLTESSADHIHSVSLFPGYNTQSSMRAWNLCFERLCARYGSTLRAVKFQCVDKNFSSPGAPWMDVLQPLLQHVRMESVDFGLCGVIAIPEWKKMASAWPNLKNLTLLASIGTPRRRQLPEDCPSSDGYNIILWLAQHCPRLEVVVLRSIHSSLLPEVSEWPRLNHKLQSLDLRVTSVENGIHLTRLIDRIFPDIDTFKLDIPGPDSGGFYMRESERLIKAYQAVRQEALANL